MIDICFIHTPVPELLDDRLDPPIGLLSMATVLTLNGYDVKVLDLSGIPESEWDFPQAGWYGFDTYTASYNRTVRIKDMIKVLYPDAMTIAGGPHATVLPGDVYSEFDVVVTGEGEEVVEGILQGNYNGIIRPNPVDLNAIPDVDFSLIDMTSYNRKFQDKVSFSIFTSRGCPYNCGFCSGVRKYRRLPVERVVQHIVDLLDQYGNISFRVKDDLFASSGRWLKQFSEQVPDIEYSCNVRADMNPIVPGLLASTGCIWACIGIESGSDEILSNMGKRTTRQQNIDTIRILQAEGINVLAWIIVGYPGETWDTVRETVTMLQEAPPDRVTVYPLIPYPGTKVSQEVKIIDKDYSHYFYIHGNRESGFVYETEDLTVSEIKSMWEYVKYKVGR